MLLFSVGIKAMETLIDNVQSEVRDENSVLWTAGDVTDPQPSLLTDHHEEGVTKVALI